MMNENRADSFLRLIRRSQRGKLKIYLGYAAGVGKTYQMLLEAHHLQSDGIDVAIGYVETHQRAETEALLAGLETTPRRKINYRGIEIEEMDLEAILKRRPSVVLVDELAHTNTPSSKNAKRYQDVEDILAAGIHVISTLNIQHLESLYETVERVTGVKVRERIPDRVVAEADQLVNVDITTEDLRQRLQEGKVYTKERVEVALEHFFRSVNLEQLRELTLRELADQIDSRRRGPSFEEELPSIPDQIMVCLSSRSPNSEALLRYASRLAGKLNRTWYAVYVQTSQEHPAIIDSATQRILSKTLILAQQLGATVFTYRGDDIVKTILQFAKEYRVGHIVIGTPGKTPSFWSRLLGKTSIPERLLLEAVGKTIVVLDTRNIPDALPSNEDKNLKKDHPQRKNSILEKETVLQQNQVIIWEDTIEKVAALKQLLDSCYRGEEKQKDAVWRALLEREKQEGTFVGEEVAIPHARITGLKEPIVAIGIGKTKIQDYEYNRSFRIMILLLTPAQPPEIHLKMLSIISKMSLDDKWCKDIIMARSSSDIINIIHEWNEHH